MMDKLLTIENEHVAILREILSNLHLEEQCLLQTKQAHRSELILERIDLRKKARGLRIEKECLLRNVLQILGPLDFDGQYDAILSVFPTTNEEEILELKCLELQKQQLIEKNLLQLKLNRNIKGMMKHHMIPLPCRETKEVVKKKKTLII